MRINNAQYADAYELRETLQLPIKLSEMLTFQEEVIKDKLTPKKRQFLSPCACGSPKLKKKFPLEEQFMEAFKSMTVKEQILLYSRSVNYLSEIVKGTNQMEFIIEQTEFDSIKIKSGLRWIEHSIRLDLNQGIMYIFGPKSEILNMSDYMLRISSDASINCFILSSTKANFSKILRLKIEDRINFELCYQSVHRLIEKLFFSKLKNEFYSSNKQLYSSFQFREQKITNRYASHQRLHPSKEVPKEFFKCGSQKVVNPISIPLSTTQQLKRQYCLHDVYSDPSEFLPKGYNYDKLTNNNLYKNCQQSVSFIKQFNDDNEIFKLEKVFSLPMSRVLEIFSNVADYPKWNTNITSSKLESMVVNTNTIIITETRQSKSKERDCRRFTYIRSLFSKNNKIYITDRTINTVNTLNKKGSNNIVLGSIVFSFWKIVPMKNYTLIEGLVKLNQNFSNKSVQIELTKQYLEGFINLDRYQNEQASKPMKQIFDISFDHKAYVEFISQILQSESSSQKQNTPSQKIDLQRKPSIDDDQFYTAHGASDWNSRILNMTKIKGLGSLSSIRSIKKISTKQFIMEPIEEQTSIIKETSSLLGSAKDVLAKEKSVPKEKQILKARKKSVQFVSSDDNYKTHICKQIQINLDKKGMTIIPLDYISQHYPIVPKNTYPYQKMKGEGWNHYLYKADWTILENGQLRFKNQQKLKFQNGVLTKVLKKVATNLISGKGFNVSLPVEVFSELSIFELTARGMCFAPLFLEKAVKQADKLQRLKYFISFSLGFSLSYLEMAKPFNPILGETYQSWINGCPFYCQQTSHHPPISSYLFIGRGYKVFGNLTPQMNLSMNSGVGYNSGQCVAVFDDDPSHKMYFRSPGGEIQGLTYGDRKFNLSGKGFYYDNQSYYSEINFNCFKKSLFSFSKQTEPTDSLEGRIYKINPQEIQRFRKKFDREGINKKQLKQEVCSISGRYTQQLSFHNKVYFNVKTDEPCMLEQQRFPLASNCNYREDIVYKRRMDNQRAQIEKERLENIQRNDRKLRGGH